MRVASESIDELHAPAMVLLERGGVVRRIGHARQEAGARLIVEGGDRSGQAAGAVRIEPVVPLVARRAGDASVAMGQMAGEV
jgi:hypothetical protein